MIVRDLSGTVGQNRPLEPTPGHSNLTDLRVKQSAARVVKLVDTTDLKSARCHRRATRVCPTFRPSF